MAKTKGKSGKKGMKYKLELTPFSIFLGGISFVFVLGCFFVLGILVGRGFVPGNVESLSDLKEQVNSLHEVMGNQKVDSPKEPEAQKPSSDPKLAFYEKLSSKKDAVKKNNTVHNKQGEKIKKTPEPKPVRKISPPVTVEEKVSDLKKSIKGSTSPETQYTVQLASLGNRESAEAMINKLINKGHPAYYYMAKVNEKIYYRIRCGRFSNVDEAENYALRLETEEGLRGFVSRFE